MMYVGQNGILNQATLLSQAKNYSGTGKWFNEVGAGYFQPGSVLGAYIGPASHGASNALILPGVASNHASSPDASALDITGDITLVAKASLDDWTPATLQPLVGKWDASSTYSYLLYVWTDGTIRLTWTTTGVGGTQVTRNSTSATGFTDSTAHWIAASLDVNDDSGNHVVKFWVSEDGTTWSQLGSTVTTAGTTSVYSGSALLRVGSYSPGAGTNLAGKFASAQVYDGVRDFSGTPSGGTLVFDADFVAQSTGTTSFTEGTGKVVTINSTGSDTNDPQWLPHSTSQNPFGAGIDHVYHPALTTVSQQISVADNAAFDTTGDIDLIVQCCPTSWANGLSQSLINRDNNGTDPNRCWALTLGTTGGLGFSWYPGGTTASQLGANSTALTTSVFSNGQAGWVRVTLDVDNGAGGYDVKFYTSADGSNWTQLGTTITGGSTTNLIASNEPLWVGDRRASGSFIFSFEGKIARAIFKHGIDGATIADFNPDGGTINSTYSTLTGTGDGLTWTLNRATSGRKLEYIERDWFLFGVDDRMLGAGFTPAWYGTEQPFTMVILLRYHATTPGSFRIFFGSGRQGVTNVSGAAIGTNGSGSNIFNINDGTTNIPKSFTTSSTFNGLKTLMAASYNPSTEGITTHYSTNGGTSATTSVSTGYTDLGTVSAGTTHISYQSGDAVYVDQVFAGAALFNRVLTNEEVLQAMQELAA